MRAVISSIAVALFLAGPMGAPAAFAKDAKTAPKSDKALDSRIEYRIHHDASLKRYKIDVTVDKGVATLSGTVPTDAAREKAARLANVSGVSRVDNQIVVDKNAAHTTTTGTAGKVEQKTKEGAEKTKDAAGKVAEKTKEGVSKTGEVITDGWITTRVKSKFLDEGVLKGSDIHVETNDHVVTLTGTVPTAAGRARAVEQAKEVEGVHRVVDKMTIGPKK
jgi:hyperosmotically inducible periplasmic protein